LPDSLAESSLGTRENNGKQVDWGRRLKTCIYASFIVNLLYKTYRIPKHIGM
jgi:hypothetical protein